MEQGAANHDQKRQADLLVQDWKPGVELYIDVAVIDPTGESHAEELAKHGVGAAATVYQKRKWKTYEDIQGIFSPIIIEAQGGFGIEAKKIVRELEKRMKEREC